VADMTVGVKLDSDTRNRLRQLGYAKDRSTHWMMKEAIAHYLDVEERYEREKEEDNARWQRYVDTGQAIRHEAVTKRIDELVGRKTRKARGR